MADLIAIGYPDEPTAFAAADEARRLAADLIIQPDAIAVIARDMDGSYHVTTSHHPMTKGASWGLFWGFLFGLLFLIPVFGMAVGAGLGALMGKLAKTSIDQQFQDQVRDMVRPGTSALFLMLEKVTPDKGRRGAEQVWRHGLEDLLAGTDPATSVPDVNCKAHELDNLYLVDTCFFPSIGAVNPALTAMANALRVGEHITQRIAP